MVGDATHSVQGRFRLVVQKVAGSNPVTHPKRSPDRKHGFRSGVLFSRELSVNSEIV